MADAAEQATVTTLRKAEPVPVQPRIRPARRSRRQLVRWVLLVTGPALLLAGIGWFWLTGGRHVSTDNAYVHTDMMNVATDVDGLVRSIEVGDNQEVRKGQVLFVLDDSIYRSALATAEANLALAATELRALQEGIDRIAAAEVEPEPPDPWQVTADLAQWYLLLALEPAATDVFGPIEIVVSNAGDMEPAPAHDPHAELERKRAAEEAELRQRLIDFLKRHHEINPTQWKDLVGQSRKFTIPLAEHFDAEKLTLRVGDLRRLRAAPSGPA